MSLSPVSIDDFYWARSHRSLFSDPFLKAWRFSLAGWYGRNTDCIKQHESLDDDDGGGG